MPIKAMVYKTLSTVVDDLFAFCIKMPFLHRLACFRGMRRVVRPAPVSL